MSASQSAKFKLELLEQYWPETEPPRFSLYSHGRIRLEIGGQVVSDGHEIYGISESALALLRTLDLDHTPDRRVAERLIFHGCGTVLMMGCPIGIDWTVLHRGDDIHIKDIARWDTPDEGRPHVFTELSVTLPLADYRRQVVTFAQQAQSLFEDQEKEFFNAEERLAYEEFWQEYETRLQEQESLNTEV